VHPSSSIGTKKGYFNHIDTEAKKAKGLLEKLRLYIVGYVKKNYFSISSCRCSTFFYVYVVIIFRTASHKKKLRIYAKLFKNTLSKS
jgi:hypothetical protein